MWPAGGEFGGRPLFLEILESPLACMRLSTTALSPWESMACGGHSHVSALGLHFPVLPGPNLLWARSPSLGQRPPAAEHMLKISN